MRYLAAVIGSILYATVASAAMWGAMNGSALVPLGAEGGTYTSCVPKALTAVNDKPVVRGMECTGTNVAFGADFGVPNGETPTTVNVTLSLFGNGTGSENACVSVACGCCGDGTTERECADPALGTASVFTIPSAVGWTATETKTFTVNSIALENGGADRACVCRAVVASAGGCTHNWTGVTKFNHLFYNW